MKYLLTAFLLISPALRLFAAPFTGGLYEGKWRSPDGFQYRFVLDIDVSGRSVEGYFGWTLEKIPTGNSGYSDFQIGMSAVEFISGSVAGSKMNFTGIHRDDPFNVIALDSYQITFTEDYSSFTGKSGVPGAWTGSLEGRIAQL